MYDTCSHARYAPPPPHSSNGSSAVREVVIVIPDLYVAAGQESTPAARALPGLEQLARSGTRATLPVGWRPWLARWLLGPDDPLSDLAPAAVAARSLSSVQAVEGAAAGSVWLATPVHLLAGLSSVHLDVHGVLRIVDEDATALAGEFMRVFEGSGWRLEALESGEFLAFGPEIAPADTVEPARWLGRDVAEGLPTGPGARVLRRLGVEIEMWLHGSPLNDVRARRGDAAISTLWLWGGGSAGPRGPSARTNSHTRLCGTDSYLGGLGAHIGERRRALPARLGEVFGYPHTSKVAVVVELASMLHSTGERTMLEALGMVDEYFLEPGARAVKDGALEQLTVLANDRRLTLHRVHRWRWWRRSRPGLSGIL